MTGKQILYCTPFKPNFDATLQVVFFFFISVETLGGFICGTAGTASLRT